MNAGFYFTAGQFAQLHGLNKRTLHYYDEIGLFSPAHKGENGYRYYTYQQSAVLEHILALRELDMSIDQIRAYVHSPSAEAFLDISAQRIQDIDQQIARLNSLRTLLEDKACALQCCAQVQNGQIECVPLPAQYLLLTPMEINEHTVCDMSRVRAHLQQAWQRASYKAGCGSYIALDKVARGDFERYDGLFTALRPQEADESCLCLPEGRFLRGYCVGDWGQIPALYGKMFAYAEAQGLTLRGPCYEIGLNEFAIAHADEYVTQITIPCCP